MRSSRWTSRKRSRRVRLAFMCRGGYARSIMKSNRSRTALLLAVTAVVVAVIAFAVRSRSDEHPGAVRVSGRQIEFPAVVTADSFEREILGMPGYHLIVWKDGRAASA